MCQALYLIHSALEHSCEAASNINFILQTRDTQKEAERDIGDGEAGSLQGAGWRTRSQDPGS